MLRKCFCWHVFTSDASSIVLRKCSARNSHGVKLVLCLRCQIVPFHAHFCETHALGALARQLCKAGDILTVHKRVGVAADHERDHFVRKCACDS